MTDNNTDLDDLRDRVAQLEQRQEKLAQGAIDAQGRSWTLSDFLSAGLSRRQAVKALGLIAGGMALPTALTRSATAAPGDDGDTVLGSSSNRWDAWMGDVDVESISAEEATITDSFLIDGVTIGSPTNATVLQTHVSDNYTTVDGIAETTVTADNTATTIWGTDPAGGNQREGMHLIFGVDTADQSQTFTELVLQTGGNVTTVVSSVTRGAPGARSYSISLGALELAIDGEGSDYTVVTQTLGGRIA